MNATSLYVSTCQVILSANAAEQSSWQDLYRLVPYLRQSMSCTVCNNLLKEPYTPTDTSCQHHVCKKCKGGRKKLKPSCSWCKDYRKYIENNQMRVLIQAYKQLCEYVQSTDIYKILMEQSEKSGSAASSNACTSLIDLLQEGASFQDDYQSTAGLSKSAYSILPCVYTNSSTQTQVAQSNGRVEEQAAATSPSTNSSSSSLYSVMYPGNGNKITIKRKAPDESSKEESPQPLSQDNSQYNNFKKPVCRSRNSANKRKGCRCGNATATPGKLTCCGQRCPCYVDSKACSECKCKGCRNPHRADGLKVRPHIPELDNLQHVTIKQETDSMESLENEPMDIGSVQQISFDSSGIKPNINVYTRQLQGVSASLPAAIMMDEDEGSGTSPLSERDSISPGQETSDISPSHSQLSPNMGSYGLYEDSQDDCSTSQLENPSDIEIEV